ncbi:hypothetical protein [Nocardioides sp. SYSU DS0651]|uniref:hypothetical protein n=1 Tax=Nocardioides sp. SYSU DS0651 TaxID=3415955 RepID=UPI003F4BA673
MNRSPSFAELLDLAEGRLDDDRARLLADRIAVDDQAADTLAWIEQFLADARRLPLHAPPADLSARLRDVFAEHHGARADDTWTDAGLLHDTRVQAAGLRSAGTQDAVHLAFDSAFGRFVLEVRRAGAGTVDLAGLVLLDRDSAGADVSFLEAGVVRRVARTDRHGRFEARDVPAVVDELRLAAGAARVRTELDLRQL